ncbi:phosphoesterase [Acinetobacter phage Herod]|nr:phosphoesterase [Acinetobacter phage Herod]
MSKQNLEYDLEMVEPRDWHAKAVEMSLQGKSSSDIAEALLGRRTQGSTVRDFLRKVSISKAAIEEVEPVEIQEKNPTILIIADTQCKPDESLEYMLWVGHYIAETKPDIIVHIGDHFDFPSLSSYDKGKASSEGRRLSDDIEAGCLGFEYLNLPMKKYPEYKPRKIFCLGNHEERLDRYVNDNPELVGTLGTDKLPFKEHGWEVHPFLKPVEVNGVHFVHYLANPFTSKPYGGTAASILKTVGRSFVVGHKQCLDIAIRPIIDGTQQVGIINGACYPFDEEYKGYQGNNHFRGITVLTEVENGFGCPSFISLDHMKKLYYSEN